MDHSSKDYMGFLGQRFIEFKNKQPALRIKFEKNGQTIRFLSD